ncbi:toll/interleukin-1 receptor domain-containing protein [Aspergillus niger CBS 101883]|uniref:toll/interleukin-1 receptor domain-containing protein n=1 Tax=Aspergillus lacticoffeatus (strain CBS 101883) TaxID=1450533 RepID=UPI000D7F51B2|nr:uncharacterized protein BO96DRAFT_471798 [Aspergillus niger CBS 101883]PYH62046.1 hypothetical protein BO96DRAFT_471798 [Aspergillus niger CBS 101883]
MQGQGALSQSSVVVGVERQGNGELVATQSTAAKQRRRPKSVFISYSSLDRYHALHLKRLLEVKGIKVWLDVFDIQTGGEFDSDLFQVIGQQDLFCLLLSPKAVQSMWVEKEIQTAQASPELYILPIILRPCNIPPELKDIIAFDATEGLDRDSVRDRLFRAVLGDFDIEGSVILSEMESELQYNKFLQDQAEEALPEIRRTVDASSASPIRRVDLNIFPETLPEDSDVILELKLKLDTLFHGTMSFFIARYREGRTWPEGYGFREPDYDEFYLRIKPRIDVQFKWFDRIVRLKPIEYGNDWKDHIERYFIEFDGTQFKPYEDLSFPQVFEIPCLRTLIKDHSSFELVSHNTLSKASTVVSEGTDISIELVGEVAQGEWLQLYRSHITKDLQNLQKAPYLSSPEMSPIFREALLSRCLVTTDGKKGDSYKELEESIIASIEKGEYSNAYEAYEKASLALQPLVMSQVPTMRDAVSMYLSVRRMVEIFMQQQSFQHAGGIISALMRVARSISESDSEEPDFQRIWADALFVEAKVNAALEQKDLAVESLVKNVDVFHQLYLTVQLPSRQRAWIAALSYAIRTVAGWQILADQQLSAWRTDLRNAIGNNDEAFELLTRPPPPPNELPVWLRDCTLQQWPTKPIKSAALRYALKLPERWDSSFTVRGTSRSIEHIYHGTPGIDAERLMIEFLEDLNEHGDITKAVTVYMALIGMPVLYDLVAQPTLLPGTWQYMGKLPSLITSLNADDACAYMGLARFQASFNLLGRIYVVLVRKGTFRWKITLSFETACLPSMPEDIVNSNDHVRAGAILGSLQLLGP